MCKITMMNKSNLLIFVFLVILTSSLTVTHSLVPLVVEGQTDNNNNSILKIKILSMLKILSILIS